MQRRQPTGFRLAAEQGNRDAQYELGQLYLAGDGVPKDAAKGRKWIRRAADQGVAMAQFSLATRYQEGAGVPKDSVRAYIWLMLGMSRCADADERNLGQKLLGKIALSLTPDQLVEAERRWAAWRPGEE